MDKYQFSPIEMSLMEKSQIPFAVYQFIDNRVVTIVLSDGFIRMFGFPDRDYALDLMDHDMYRDTHPEDVADVAEAALRFARHEIPYNVTYRTKISDEYHIIHSLGEHIEMPDGTKLAVIWYVDEGTDVAESTEKSRIQTVSVGEYEDTIFYIKHFDSLTGLPNINYFQELAEAGIAKIRRSGKIPAILFLDLNGMKFYNRKFGLREGDRLLHNIGKILTKYFHNENCGRLAKDCFLVYTSADGMEEKLHTVFRECKELNNGNGLSMRAGIYRDVNETDQLSDAIDRAKFACDMNRGSYRSVFRYFDNELLTKAEQNQYVIDNIDRALAEGWIKDYYQPIIRSANGMVCDEEALARWIDPVKGFLVPADFIPALEEAGLIYKLDLYLVDRVIEKMKTQAEAGLYVVPVSVNFSRTDFDACDLVEEVRQRVDAAGISRDKLTIEITESVVGSDFDFIKRQVCRFQKLGFHVWMDDFGSGYSSLDVLQSIHFDLIKFDMRFMQQFDNGNESKIILTELMKMAIGLGIDTLAEGVERQEQVDFLREVGCTKMQGFYYTKPIPQDEVMRRYREGRQIGFENPDEAEYYTALGRINLYDVAVLAREDQESLQKYFDTIPISVVESNDDEITVNRCNPSFRAFSKRMGWNAGPGKKISYTQQKDRPGFEFLNVIRQCGVDGRRAIIDDLMPNGETVHAFIRRIAVNPVNGTAAIVVAVLDVAGEGKQNSSALTYTHIAHALSADYFNLFYVNLETEDFIQYNSNTESGQIAVERHGKNFFREAREDAKKVLFEDDVDIFVDTFTKENVIRTLDEHDAFTLIYRQYYRGVPVYVNMKAVRLSSAGKYIIVGVNNIDAQMRQKKDYENAMREEIRYSRITALSGDLICIYTVDPETGHYAEYSSTKDYECLGLAREGEDFFRKAYDEAEIVLDPSDVERFRRLFTLEKVLKDIEENKLYGLRYRLLIDGVPTYVSVKAALVEENGCKQLIIGVHNIDSRIKRDQAYEQNSKPES